MTTVLDASAVLTLLFGEPGAESVADAIAAGAALSTVNLAEVGTVFVRNGVDRRALEAMQEQVVVEPLSAADAVAIAALYPQVASRGLSLGDRACLALARRLELPALTADRAWADLGLDIEVLQVRR